MIRVKHIYGCEICANNVEHVFDLPGIGGEMPQSGVPIGWKLVNNVLICDQHEIKIFAKKEGTS